MRRILALILASALLITAAGCSGERNKGVNKDKDRPKLEEKQN
jgi:uncharacterized lipoprotein